jgi:hypothetical protein
VFSHEDDNWAGARNLFMLKPLNDRILTVTTIRQNLLYHKLYLASLGVRAVQFELETNSKAFQVVQVQQLRVQGKYTFFQLRTRGPRGKKSISTSSEAESNQSAPYYDVVCKRKNSAGGHRKVPISGVPLDSVLQVAKLQGQAIGKERRISARCQVPDDRSGGTRVDESWIQQNRYAVGGFAAGLAGMASDEATESTRNPRAKLDVVWKRIARNQLEATAWSEEGSRTEERGWTKHTMQNARTGSNQTNEQPARIFTSPSVGARRHGFVPEKSPA